MARGRAALWQLVDEWQALAEEAELPNPFYEPWMLLPALEHLPGGDQVECLLVRHGGELVGLLPVQWQSRCKNIPWPTLSAWQHRYCFLCVPLLKKSVASEAAAALVRAMRRKAGSMGVLRFPLLDRHGPTAKHLSGAEGPKGLFLESMLPRPLMVAGRCPESYLERAISRRSRKRLQRQREGLEQLGEVRFEQLQPGEPSTPWLEEFLQLESSGWKGRSGTALACDPPGLAFFRAAAEWGHRLGKLGMTALRAGGQLVAMDCNVRSQSGLYAFKTAYNEEFAEYSPGVMLEVQTLRLAHERGDIRWIDSCVASLSSPLGRLYQEHREVVTYLAPSNGWPSALFLSVLPWLQRIARWARGKPRAPEAVQPAFAI